MSDKNDALLADIAQSLACISYSLEQIAGRMPKVDEPIVTPAHEFKRAGPYVRDENLLESALHKALEELPEGQTSVLSQRLVDSAAEYLPAPEGRDTRRANLTRALRMMSSKAGSPFALHDRNIVCLLD